MEHIKRSFWTAAQKIKHSFKEFLPFFIAIFLVQCIFFTAILSFQSNATYLTEETGKGYSYHVLISGLAEDEMLILKENRRAVFLNEFYYTPLSIKEYTSPGRDSTYDMTVKLLTGNKDYGIFSLFRDDSLKANYEAMLFKYADILVESDHVSLYLSPLYNLEASISSLNATRNLLTVFLFLCNFLLLFVLYKLYVSKQTFSFGIFATFGAGYKRLRENAFTQLFLISIYTLLPAYYASLLICHLFYASAGYGFYFQFVSIKIWLAVLIMMAPLLLLVVRTPIRLLAHKPPVELLQAADAKDLVSSPSASSNLIRKGFPFGYEALSFWRFRKHHVTSAIVSAFLCVLLAVGIMITETYQANTAIENATKSDFTVQFRDVETISDEQFSFIASAEGIKNAHRVYPESLLTLHNSLLVIEDDLITNNLGFANDAENGVSYTGDARLIPASFETLDYYSDIYRTTGELSTLLEGTNRVIIGSSYQNRDSFSFSVGDTVQIAIPSFDEEGEMILKENASISEFETGEGLWKEMYEAITYRYITLEIVGIIEDYPSGMNGIPLLVSADVYQAISGQEMSSKTVSVAVDTASGGSFDSVFDELSRICALLGKATVTMTGASFQGEVEKHYCYSQFIPTLSFLLFAFLPLIWFYSQNAITQRREEEYKILYSLSVPPQKMRRLCLSSSILLLPVCLVILLLTVGATAIFSHLFNRILPNVFHISASIVGSVTLPLWVYGVILAALFLCFLLSFFIPYFYYTSIKRSFAAKP